MDWEDLPILDGDPEGDGVGCLSIAIVLILLFAAVGMAC